MRKNSGSSDSIDMHEPVLVKKVMDILKPQPGEKYIDATINGGGHTKAILEHIGPEGKVLGIDRDCELLQRIGSQRIKDKNLRLVCGNYRDIKKIAEENGFEKVNGILFDLGFSSYHLEKSGRGFSFRRDEPLDMRYNPPKNPLTAEKIVNGWSERELEKVFKEYGEERFSRRIAAGIIQARAEIRISRSKQLADIVRQSVPSPYSRRGIHPATRVFQALRIAVNEELENLKKALDSAPSLLASSGRIAVISFHSLEDRIVKQFFKKKETEGTLSINTKKPLTASFREKKENPRARSAKLRAAQKQ